MNVLKYRGKATFYLPSVKSKLKNLIKCWLLEPASSIKIPSQKKMTHPKMVFMKIKNLTIETALYVQTEDCTILNKAI